MFMDCSTTTTCFGNVAETEDLVEDVPSYRVQCRVRNLLIDALTDGATSSIARGTGNCTTAFSKPSHIQLRPLQC